MSLATLPTYVRTEVRDSKNALLAMSEPIFFIGVTGLPARMSYHVVGVTTPDGKNYTNIAVQGITASSWDGTAQALSLTLANPTGSLVELSSATAGLTPTAFSVGGNTVSPASSLASFQTATGSTWFYDTATGILHLKATQGTASGTSIRVSFSGSIDTQPPSAPSNLHQTANDQTSVSLAWNASSDNVGVAHYNVYLDGQLTSSPTTTSTTVAGLTCGTSHSFSVEAADAVGNLSPRTTITAGTATCPPTTTLTPTADAYVDASAGSSNFGTSTKLRVDTSPDVRSYLKFNLAGLSGVTSATLRIFATSALTSGYDVRSVSDNSWTETGLTYANAPAAATTVAGSSGPVTASSWTSIDVTSLVTGGGDVSFAVTGRSTTALSLASRESGATAPQLVVQATGGATDNQPPTTPTNLHTTGNTTTTVSLAWTASTDNVGVDHYTVYVDGNASGQPAATTFTAGGLACGTSHSFAVEAVDGAGNISTRSGVLSAGTAACSGNDTQPPTTPTNLQTTAVAQTSISLAWTASTDNVGVTGYRVYDGTTQVGSPTNTTFTLSGLTCGTSHTFSVDALDAASNASPHSTALTVSTTQCGGSNTTFIPAADAYVDGSVPTTTFGNGTKLRVDTSPDVRSYLRFNVTGLSGTVTRATLLVFATSALTAGYDVRSVSDNTWTEPVIDYANAPPVAATVTASSGPVTASTWVSVDVTSLVSGNGVVSFALTGRSTTALALASRESTTTAPQLVITTS